MVKSKIIFFCIVCGLVFIKWFGKCDGCGEWNIIVEDMLILFGFLSVMLGSFKGKLIILIDLWYEEMFLLCIFLGVNEFDCVLGGGFVFVLVIFVGGDSGIGKFILFF